MRICMLLHKSVVHDSRVRREARALAAAGHEVTVVHLPRERHADELRVDGFRVVCATPPAGVRRALPFHAYRLAFLAGFVRLALRSRPDVLHAHDAPMLAPGLLAARLAGARLVYDSHELATGVPYRDGRWARFVGWVEHVGVPRADAVITVSDGIAERIQDLYGLSERPVVVRNATDLTPPERPTGRLRARLGVGDAPLVLHQGAPAEDRGCEVLIAAMEELPDAHLCFLGSGEPDYEEKLQALADGRVHFLPSVPLGELLEWTADADVGVSLLQDTCENHRLALPNKVFEYVAAGVPVVVSDLPELQALVNEHGIGVAVPAGNPASIAAGVRTGLRARGDRPIQERMANTRHAFAWSLDARRLREVYSRLHDSR